MRKYLCDNVYVGAMLPFESIAIKSNTKIYINSIKLTISNYWPMSDLNLNSKIAKYKCSTCGLLLRFPAGLQLLRAVIAEAPAGTQRRRMPYAM